MENSEKFLFGMAANKVEFCFNKVQIFSVQAVPL